MAGMFKRSKFSDCSLSDPFFETLKNDYPEFTKWFGRKALEGEEAFIFEDDDGISAFVYLKKENEEIILIDKILPAKNRLKIGTLKLDNRQQGQRLGEGAIGISLWAWQEDMSEEIYLTVYEKHTDVIALVEKFGFVCQGKNLNGECVYIKSRKNLDYSSPHRAFPFINPTFTSAGMLPIYDHFHDRLFPYSELKNTNQEFWDEAAGNGITKIFIGSPNNLGAQDKIKHLDVGNPVFLYRISTDANSPKTYRSCITSFATISKAVIIKNSWKANVNIDDFIELCGNKSIFSDEELRTLYNRQRNLIVFELVYNGFFGKGHNVIHKELNNKGLFPTYPYNIVYSKDNFIDILEMGGKDGENIIID